MCAALCAAVLSGCSSASKETGGDGKIMPEIDFKAYEYDAVAVMADSLSVDVEGGDLVRFYGKGMLPLKMGSNDVTQLRDSLEKLGRVLITGKSQTEPRLDPGLTLSGFSPSDTTACSMVGNILTVSLCSPEIVVWKNYFYSYLCRAAHGFYNTTFVNYGVADGKILSIADIMKPGYEEELRELIREKIKEEDVGLLVPITEVDIPSDFEITQEGIRFLYGLYEIAPYAEGEISVSFNAYELDGILSQEAVARYFNMPG